MISNQIVRTIGIDVHKDTYTLAAFAPESEAFVAETTTANSRSVIKYIERLAKQYKGNVGIVVGYEAGPTGFGLKRDLDKEGIECHVMAPTSIPKPAGGVKTKTDRKDARTLAQVLYWGTYSESYEPGEESEAVRDFMRMRDDMRSMLKRNKRDPLVSPQAWESV